MKEFMYSIGNIQGRCYKCVFESNKIKVTFEFFDKKYGKCKYYDIPNDFENKIKSIIKDWEDMYVQDEPTVLIGNLWEIRVVFDDGSIFESNGNDAYPENFKELSDCMETFIKELRIETEKVVNR